MAGVKGRSGRQAEKPLTARAVARLYEGVDLGSIDGLRELLRRADDLNLRGKIPAHRYRLFQTSIARQLELALDADRRSREAAIEEAIRRIESARAGAGSRFRDVGPPPDDAEKG
jgi:hypothetical protein